MRSNQKPQDTQTPLHFRPLNERSNCELKDISFSSHDRADQAIVTLGESPLLRKMPFHFITARRFRVPAEAVPLLESTTDLRFSTVRVGTRGENTRRACTHAVGQIRFLPLNERDHTEIATICFSSDHEAERALTVLERSDTLGKMPFHFVTGTEWIVPAEAAPLLRRAENLKFQVRKQAIPNFLG